MDRSFKERVVRPSGERDQSLGWKKTQPRLLAKPTIQEQTELPLNCPRKPGRLSPAFRIKDSHYEMLLEALKMFKRCRYGLAALILAIVGCGSDFDDNTTTGQQGNPGVVTSTSFLRVVNPTFALSDLTVTIDGTPVDTDLDSLGATDYIELESGQHQIVVAGPAQGSGAILDRQVTLDNNEYASLVIVTDSSSFQDPSTQEVGITFDFLQLEDDVVTEPRRLQLRLVNAFPAPSNVSVETLGGFPLGGPVRESSAGPYADFNPQEVAPLAGFTAIVKDLSGAEIERGEFRIEGRDPLVTPQEFQSTGVNLTLFVSYSLETNQLALFGVKDERDDGNDSTSGVEQ
jgi:uncharacterized protein DUF4397